MNQNDPQPFEEISSSTTTNASAGETLVQVAGLTVRYGTQVVLRDVSFTIPRGQTLAIIGESGCGKTILMKTLVGLVKPTAGNVLFDGQNLAHLSDYDLAIMRRRFGFVFQNAALFDSMTVFQNIAFPIRQQETISSDTVRSMVMQRLAEVGLPPEVARKRPAELSGGMRKRVGLARAMIMEPELLFYDEPTTGLDPIMSDVINELILATRHRYPVTSIVVTHDMHTARKVADRVMMLYPRSRLDSQKTQILFDGPPSDLEHAKDRRVRQFVRGEAGDRLNELTLNR